MQTWARRGAQTALVTGGLLMLGTSIASADENVSPDRPASAIDGGAAVSPHVEDNAVGTPVGQVRPPAVNRTIGTDGVTGTASRPISTPAAGVPGASGAPGAVGLLRANRARTDIVVPVDVSGNVLAEQGATPVQVNGNAIAGAGGAHTRSTTASTATSNGTIGTDGAGGSGSGNIVALPTAVPAQAFDGGLSVVGNGSTTGFNDTTAGSGGAATADGSGGTVAGDVVHAPVAGPVQAFGVAAASPGNEEADSLNNTYTTAGDDTVTSGDHGAFAGDTVTPQITQVEQVFGVGLAGAGNSTADGFNNTATRSGGDVRTSGEWGALSGDLVDVPATDVTQTPADGVAAAGHQRTLARSTTSAVSGGSSATTGDGTTDDGVPVATPVGVPATVFRVPVEVLGSAIESGHQTTYVDDGDRTIEDAPPIGVLQAQRRLGPSDQTERQLRADQVPAIADLLRVPNLRGGVPGAPVGLLDQTQIFPAIVDGLPGREMTPQSEQELTQRLPVISGGVPLSTMEITQRIPVVPSARIPDGRPAPRPQRVSPDALPNTQPMPAVRGVPAPRPGPGYRPINGDLPVIGAAPPAAGPTRAVPGYRAGVRQPTSLPSLPDLPPVPTLPAMPPLPDPNRPTPQSGRAGPQPPSLFTPNIPSVTVSDLRTPPPTDGTPQPQDMPAGPAEQLMAQLRGLISELGTGEAEPPIR
jgi:hypothetical protein